MRILVTRPLPDAWTTKAQIERLGYEAILAPLLDIEFNEIKPEFFDDVSALIVTSQNALRSLSFSGLQDKAKHLQVYAVGEATATMAQELKLLNITAGRGTARDLAPVIAERQAKRAGRILHLTGDHRAYDLNADLQNRGLVIDDIVAYRQVAAKALPPDVANLIMTGRIDAVTLFSPRTAEIWSKLTSSAAYRERVKNLVHICISEAAASKLAPESAIDVRIAAEPTAEQIFVLIKGLAARAEQE